MHFNKLIITKNLIMNANKGNDSPLKANTLPNHVNFICVFVIGRFSLSYYFLELLCYSILVLSFLRTNGLVQSWGTTGNVHWYIFLWTWNVTSFLSFSGYESILSRNYQACETCLSHAKGQKTYSQTLIRKVLKIHISIHGLLKLSNPLVLHITIHSLNSWPTNFRSHQWVVRSTQPTRQL